MKQGSVGGLDLLLKYIWYKTVNCNQLLSIMSLIMVNRNKFKLELILMKWVIMKTNCQSLWNGSWKFEHKTNIKHTRTTMPTRISTISHILCQKKPPKEQPKQKKSFHQCYIPKNWQFLERYCNCLLNISALSWPCDGNY